MNYGGFGIYFNLQRYYRKHVDSVADMLTVWACTKFGSPPNRYRSVYLSNKVLDVISDPQPTLTILLPSYFCHWRSFQTFRISCVSNSSLSSQPHLSSLRFPEHQVLLDRNRQTSDSEKAVHRRLLTLQRLKLTWIIYKDAAIPHRKHTPFRLQKPAS